MSMRCRNTIYKQDDVGYMPDELSRSVLVTGFRPAGSVDALSPALELVVANVAPNTRPSCRGTTLRRLLPISGELEGERPGDDTEAVAEAEAVVILKATVAKIEQPTCHGHGNFDVDRVFFFFFVLLFFFNLIFATLDIVQQIGVASDEVVEIRQHFTVDDAVSLGAGSRRIVT